MIITYITYLIKKIILKHYISIVQIFFNSYLYYSSLNITRLVGFYKIIQYIFLKLTESISSISFCYKFEIIIIISYDRNDTKLKIALIHKL